MPFASTDKRLKQRTDMIEFLRESRNEVRKMLWKYGKHTGECAYLRFAKAQCDCGWREIFDELEYEFGGRV